VTLLEVINRTTEFFQKRGLESPRLQIELLLAHVLQLPRMQLYLQFERELLEGEAERLRPLVKRRADREPLQYILGQVHFDGLKLKCAPGVLIPRPETELLVDLIKKDLSPLSPATLADIGTGSGAIALSLAKALPVWKILAVEPSEEALTIFQLNLHDHADSKKIVSIHGSLMESIQEPVQVVVANLPYLTTEEMKKLEPELAFEPSCALHGGSDGLELIRLLITGLPDTVQRIYLEIGIAQASAVRLLLQEKSFTTIVTHQDLAGFDRFVFGTRL
jgi:release factor glutamine methyltransferase